MSAWFKRKKEKKKREREEAPEPLPQERSEEDTLPEEEPPEADAVSDLAEESAAEPEPLPAETEAEVVPEVEAALPEAEVLEDEETADVPEEVKRRRGLFRRLRERLGKTREAMASRLDRLFLGKKVIDEDLLDELEELLVTADIGVDTALALIDVTRQKVRRKELSDPARLKDHLRAQMVSMLSIPVPPVPLDRPRVVMIIGVNGVGKTTTIAKLAHRSQGAGQQVLLVAADTFRAAAVEQLEIWGERLGVEVIRQKTGADPAAVVYDGLAAAASRGVDTVYIDTAGRLHTKVNLMEELKKITRTAAKQIAGAPHEVYLVLDATTGQNAISQARLFHQAIGVTGLIVTKLDGTAKGGVVLGIVQETGLPLRFIGVGEQMDDLRPFEAEAFIDAILA